MGRGAAMELKIGGCLPSTAGCDCNQVLKRILRRAWAEPAYAAAFTKARRRVSQPGFAEGWAECMYALRRELRRP